jgi:predicted  nucleic acid-binding Zn-ribbon protein
MENTVAQNLEALLKLQALDSKTDSIKKVRGALPEEVKDLEDELIGYQTRADKHKSELDALNLEITNRKSSIKESEKLIKKYEEQQMNVRNNREYDAISKEMELQALEIQISEKKIKEAHYNIEKKNEEIAATDELLKERNKDLQIKKKELNTLIAESEEDENKLGKERVKASKRIEDRLLISYQKIRNNAGNGLAVVTVKRGACGGCFNMVPPQRQADIREKKKLIVCEHCGRILAGAEDVVVVEEKKPRRSRAATTKKAPAAKK